MYKIDEIAPDVFRISIFFFFLHLQFNHFFIKDDEALLYHAVLRHVFPTLLDSVQTLIDPAVKVD
jgi:hypothetical protein